MKRLSNMRTVLAVVLGAVLIAAVASLAFAAPPPGKGKAKASVAQYAYGPAGKQYGKNRVAICHKGKTIRVAQPAVKAHLRHGDRLGACS